jgi:fumarate reductase subunit D
LVVVAVLFMILWHTAHRFYYVLHDFHIHVGIKTRYALYAFVIACALWTLVAGW